MLFARLGLWELVRRDWARAFQLRSPESSWKWLLLALIHLDAGDTDAYGRLCADMRKRFSGGDDPVVALDLVRACMALPDPKADPREMAELAGMVATTHPEVPWVHYVAGLAAYRAGHDERAVELFRRSREAGLSWPAREINLPLLALAYHRQGKAADAEQALAEADEVRDGWLTAMFDGVDDTGWAIHQNAEPRWPISWCDWFEFVANRCQAHLTLRGAAPTDDARLTVLRARGLAGLRLRRDADALYSAALSALPDDPRILLESHRNRGYIQAEAGQWHDAAEEFAAASELRPDDVRLWSFVVSARLAAGELEAYRQGCREMFRRFQATTDSAVAHQLVSACTIGADALPEMAPLIPLGRLAASRGLGNARLWGAACYRAGRFEDARLCFEEAARLVRPTAWLWCFLALTHERQGRHDEARRCLAEAEAWVDAADHRTGDDVSEDGPSWNGMGNRIDNVTLLREVRSLVDGRP